MPLIGCFQQKHYFPGFFYSLADGGDSGFPGGEANTFNIVPDPVNSHGVGGCQFEGNKIFRRIHSYRFNTAESFEFCIKSRDAGYAIHPFDGQVDGKELRLCGQAKAQEQRENLHGLILTYCAVLTRIGQSLQGFTLFHFFIPGLRKPQGL